MGLPHRSMQWPILRKVFRVGQQFVCGICRAPFESQGAAQSCLVECWQEILTQDGVTMRPSLAGLHAFRCRFCSRDYANRGQAEACAKACRERLAARAEQDQFDEDGGERTPKKKAFARPRPQPARPAPARRPAAAKPAPSGPAPADMSLQSDIVRQITATAESKVVQVTKTDDTADGPNVRARGRPRTEFKKTFIRDGAKYVCSYCRKNYFTKGEVEACFDTHFDSNGYEIVQG